MGAKLWWNTFRRGRVSFSGAQARQAVTGAACGQSRIYVVNMDSSNEASVGTCHFNFSGGGKKAGHVATFVY